MQTHAITLREHNEDVELNYKIMMSPNPKVKSEIYSKIKFPLVFTWIIPPIFSITLSYSKNILVN